MKKLFLLQLGNGNVGGTLIRQISEHAGKQVVYCGIFTSKGGVFKKSGLSGKPPFKAVILGDSRISKRSLKNVSADRDSGKVVAFQNDVRSLEIASLSGMNVEEAIDQMPQPFVLIDTTASDKTVPLMKRALKRGGFVVMSNKKPIASTQKDFDALHKLGSNRLFYETSVGAGLPVIATLKTLLATGDEVISIQGCFSGTLGYLFSEIENGAAFSSAVKKAKALGFTEPDPRDDLSGLDVARKALILARIMGLKLALSDVKLESLYPKKMEKLTIDEFLDTLADLDASYKEKADKAQKEGKVLRFVATVTKKGCTVGLESVPKTSDIGSLSGPDNLIVFRTKRYDQHPLVVKGPGAGAEVTAAGVFGDISAIATINF